MRDGRICAQNLEILLKRISSHKKFSIFWKFLPLWNKIPIFEKFIDFCVMLGNFLVFMIICYYRSEVFRFHQELNTDQFKNLEFNHWISHTLPVFGEIVLCIYANDFGFKKYKLWKKSIFRQLNTEVANFANIKQNNTIFAQKKGGRNSF